MKSALLIIDMQKIFLEDELDGKMIGDACEHINYVASVFRSKDHMVVHVQDVEGMDEGNQTDYDFIPQIEIGPSDFKVTKEFSNVFWQTDLEQLLQSHGVEFVIIAGFAAEHCVLFTYNGASERGFVPVLLQNGILSTNPDVIASTYRDRNLISHPVVQYL